MQRKIIKFVSYPQINEHGSIMVVALLILALLSIIGISATTTTEIETLISRNEKFHKIAFYNADSGIYPATKLISTCIDIESEPSVSAISYLGASGTFYREIMGYDSWDSDRDIQFVPSSHTVQVDVNRTGAQNLAGGGVEFASGAEGVGVGATGGVAVFYDIDSRGDGPANSDSNIIAEYRKVVGTPGGL
jgi:Tfp pilus assembly protein PilX